jgi:hypothetical protein
MGKWAQSKKRGGGGSVTSSPPPPPPPLITGIDLSVYVIPQGEEDYGGFLTLQQSNSADGPWDEIGEGDWAPAFLAGAKAIFVGTWLRATERGNGSTYAGTSNPSTPLFIE